MILSGEQREYYMMEHFVKSWNRQPISIQNLMRLLAIVAETQTADSGHMN